MPNGDQRNVFRLCSAIDGFRLRYGSWPTRVRIVPSAIEDLSNHLLGKRRFAKVQAKIQLISEKGAEFIAEDEIGNSYNYGREGEPKESLSGTLARDWLGFRSLPSGDDECPVLITIFGKPNPAALAIKQKLIGVVREIAKAKKADLDNRKKAAAGGMRTDFVWHYMLSSFSTMGNSRGAQGLIHNKLNYDRVRYEVLANMSSRQRLKVIENTFKAAKIRMPVKKAAWLNENFGLISKMGGPELATTAAMSLKGREAKIAFMKQFHGFGEKYARNVFMQVYDPDFRDSIAVDERIKKVSKFLGLKFFTYSEQENFYLSVAHEVGIQGWELDRLLYNYADDMIQRLNVKPS